MIQINLQYLFLIRLKANKQGFPVNHDIRYHVGNNTSVQNIEN